MPGAERLAFLRRGRSIVGTLVVAVIAYCAIYLSIHFLPVADDARAGWTANLVLVPSLVSAVMGWFAFKSSTGRDRRIWRLITISLAALALAETSRLLTLPPIIGAADISPADIFRLAGYLVLVPVVLAIAQHFEILGLRRIRSALDFLTLVLVVLVSAYLTLLRPLGVLETSTGTAAALKLAFYPVAALALVLYLFVFKRDAYRRWETLIVIAISAFAAGDVGYDLFVLLDLWSPGELLTGVLSLTHVIGFGIFAVAAELKRVGHPDDPGDISTATADRSRWPAATAMVLSLLGIPVLLVMGTRSASPVDGLVFTYSGVALTWLIVTRNVVVSDENRRLIERSVVDPLTGLFSHSHFYDRLSREVRAATRNGDMVSLCILDVDGFTQINRRLGYRAGDMRLRTIAQRLQARTRAADTCFRIGGDDFAVIMPGTDPVSAFAACARMVEELGAPDDRTQERVTFSVGISGLPLNTSDVEELARLAEGATYWVKTHGGDRVIIYDPEVVQIVDEKDHIRHLEQRSHSSMVEVLAAAVDARDPYTRFHSANVSQYSAVLAGAMGFDTERVELIRAAALLHDVGKIGITDQILRKPGRLTDVEMDEVREHPVLGVRILQSSTRKDMLPWIRGHHERWDGGGYPDGLSGEHIPLEARLICICDSFDAMTTNRPYRPGMGVEEAVKELRACTAAQFDPQIVALFVQLLETGVIAPVASV